MIIFLRIIIIIITLSSVAQESWLEVVAEVAFRWQREFLGWEQLLEVASQFVEFAVTPVDEPALFLSVVYVDLIHGVACPRLTDLVAHYGSLQIFFRHCLLVESAVDFDSW